MISSHIDRRPLYLIRSNLIVTDFLSFSAAGVGHVSLGATANPLKSKLRLNELKSVSFVLQNNSNTTYRV